MKSKESIILFRFKFAEIDITADLVFPGRMQELSTARWRDCKRHKKVHTSRQGVAGFFLRKKKESNTRFPEFLTRFWIRACGGCLD